jgi:hypothetical protein
VHVQFEIAILTYLLIVTIATKLTKISTDQGVLISYLVGLDPRRPWDTTICAKFVVRQFRMISGEPTLLTPSIHILLQPEDKYPVTQSDP